MNASSAEQAVVHRAHGSRLSTAVVLIVLAAAAYAGHRVGWTLPKFSSLFGSRETEPDWCEEHAVPEDACIECRADLAPRRHDYGWCPLHGVAECPWEHPDVAETKRPPQVTPEQLAAAQRALELTPRPANNSRCELHKRRVQFASAEAAAKAGVDVAVVDVGPVLEAVVANGEVLYDQTRSAQLSSRLPGTVARVLKQVGDRVRRGEVLALIDSAEVGKAKADYLQALAHERLVHVNMDRLRPLAAGGDVAERQFREAQAADEEAHIKLLGTRQALVNLGFAVDAATYEKLPIDEAAARLQWLGLSDEVRATLPAGTATSNLFPLVAPLDGMVGEREIVDGEAVDTQAMLFAVVDPSRMWLMLDVRQDDVDRIAPGMSVRFAAAGRASAAVVEGRIAWISSAIDERTRTVKVRVELPNPDGRLRANTFGTAQIVLREEPQAIVVPTSAVHWEGCCHVAFVRDRAWFEEGTPKYFHVRKVRLGVRDGDRTEILAGLLPGEVIADRGSGVVAAQLMRSKLGDHCECAH